MLRQILKNRYRIIHKLGEGAFGHTYLAEDLDCQIRQYFVVKHLQPDLTQYKVQDRLGIWQEAKRLFDREAKTLAKLGSCTSQIPTMEECFEENNEFYIVQEWIEGETLEKEISDGQLWTQKDTIQLLIEILEPLSVCHINGVIHRDLKPANLLRRLKNKELVIIDFGAATEEQLSPVFNSQSSPGTRIGTEGYMPDEQSKGFPLFASDIYAVGAIGMQVLTGLEPCNMSRDQTTVNFPWQKVPGRYATAAFANVLNRMLADSAVMRYPDIASVLAALEALRPIVLRGNLSKEIFTFETAKVQQVQEVEFAIVKKPGWFGLWEKEERQTTMVKVWKTLKMMSKAERFVEDLGKGTELEMVYIPAGTFMMGAPKSESNRSDNEQPEHLVAVSEFYMGRYAVTQSQYLAVMGKNPARWQGAQLPVERVSWHDAQEFCQKLSVKTGKKYQLPSEAMWEYACRAGTTTRFHFGEVIDLVAETAYEYTCLDFRCTTLFHYEEMLKSKESYVANFGQLSTYANVVKDQHRGKTTVVGTFPANNFGLADMHGNVWEWCEDHLHENYQGAPLDGSSWSGNDNDAHLLRGGSCFGNPRDCRSACRYGRSADVRNNYIGFRVIHLQDS
jgi:eukaryotic-like serine/threonine-protein kinase